MIDPLNSLCPTIIKYAVIIVISMMKIFIRVTKKLPSIYN